MRRIAQSSFVGTWSLAGTGCLLVGASFGKGFVHPGAAVPGNAWGCQGLAPDRPTGIRSFASAVPDERGEEIALAEACEEKFLDGSARSPARRLRSLLFSRKSATAAALSAVLSASAPESAEALFGQGKALDAPQVPSIQQQVEEASDSLAEVVQEMVGEEGEDVAEKAAEYLEEASEGMEDAASRTVENAQEHLEDAEDSLEEGGLPVLTPSEDPDSVEESDEGLSSAILPREGSERRGGAAGFLRAGRRTVAENPKAAAVAIVGAAGVTFAVTRMGGPEGGGSRRRGNGSSRSAAPKSPVAGIGKPRVAPEVAEADAKRKADSLKSATFDVDVELFGDAVSDLPARPPPPLPPAEEPSPSPSETIQAAMAARDERVVLDAEEAATAAQPEVDASAIASSEPSSPATEKNPAPVESAAPPAAAESEPPASEASTSVAAASPVQAPTQDDKQKRKGRPIMNLFNRDKGPQRATTVGEALSAETPDLAAFRQATAAMLAQYAPADVFKFKEPTLLEEATITLEDGEGEAGAKAAAASRMRALKELMGKAGLSTTEAADIVADVVNAMVVRLVDDAVKSRDDQATSSASDALLSYMDGAGELFGTLCPGVELSPPIRYNGSFKRGKLEKVFETAARKALKLGDESQMGKLDRLQDVFTIKESKANSITQKIMMDLMMKMMSEGGGGEDTEGLEKMMAAMGAEGMGGMPGMSGSPKSPEEQKQEIDALRAMVDSGDCPKEEVDSLRKMYKDAGMDIDQLVNDPLMEGSMDANAKEVVVLLRKLLALHPK